MKYRDTILETVQEYNRCGQFVRIFPCKHSKPYEKYFSGVYGTRMLNRLVHKILFTNEVLPYEKHNRHGNDDPSESQKEAKKDLKYELDGLATEQTYDHYKTKALQK